MANSTAKTRRIKPEKPHKDFPLFAHQNGQWCKKVRGKQHFFGIWADPDAALAKWLEVKDALLAGRTPRTDSDGPTLRIAVNHFLNTKRHFLDTRELSERSFRDYFRVCETVIGFFGKDRLLDDLRADDFAQLRVEMAKKRGSVALGNEIGKVRVLFKHCYDAELIDRPIRYGPGFRKPSRKTLRIAKQAAGPRMFDALEVRKMLEAASGQMRAMILLGINAAYGQSDCATLPQTALDLDAGWANFARGKTKVERHCPLWPESIEALREAVQNRPEVKDEADAGLVFITKYGNRWVRMSKHEEPGRRTPIDSISLQFRKLLKRIGINGGRGFYCLRHTFQTIGDEARDPVATSALMGHVDGSMAGQYRERISDERLKAVTDTVRNWLRGTKSKEISK